VELTSGRSDDNNNGVIRARIVEYHQMTAAVAAYYSKFNKVVHVHGESSVTEIFDALCNAIDAKQTAE
jgi:adenylate kinase